ncbi:unnamed protein product [Linum trigynum]|uniref:Uncharacterized protein n=1 Tax=Linum trigynum TaxID=586398 RepID=A0AAV2FKA3_9ROSI
MTTQVKLTDADLTELRESKRKYAQVICNMCKFYRDWHIAVPFGGGRFQFCSSVGCNMPVLEANGKI